MKNPLRYVDYCNDLIKFGFAKKHNFLAMIAVFSMVLMPICFLAAYAVAPSEKSLQNPYIFSGTVENFFRFHSYKSGNGCKISVAGNGKIFSWEFIDFHIDTNKYDYEEKYFCDFIFSRYINNKCVILKMINLHIVEFGDCDNKVIIEVDLRQNFFEQKLFLCSGIILALILFLIFFKLNKAYKNSLKGA
ncbi:hypothetical protein [uncultured Campylobacter sp.]|uniref:hypothetical protein n=1 Tax=uncultured Campylobacter sp. TaxID=218934 RepID=UPI00260DA05B|nr:hypothetical protein [uncultured Campylobacter sp.]